MKKRRDGGRGEGGEERDTMRPEHDFSGPSAEGTNVVVIASPPQPALITQAVQRPLVWIQPGRRDP